MALVLKNEHAEAIRGHGESSYPDECCGLILGRSVQSDKVVERLWPADNAREPGRRRNRFLIPPQVMIEAQKTARLEEMEVLGFYHSHPDAEARPSAYDLEHGWPVYSYIIVSVEGKKARSMTSWVMTDDRACFHPEPLRIGE